MAAAVHDDDFAVGVVVAEFPRRRALAANNDPATVMRRARRIERSPTIAVYSVPHDSLNLRQDENPEHCGIRADAGCGFLPGYSRPGGKDVGSVGKRRNSPVQSS
jgi:hypothetical protein